MNAFEVPRRIRFSDCDPAGIVFYPQYFVMFNGLLEDWVDGPLGIGFAELVSRRRIGLPTVRLEADFRAVSRFGDDVLLSLAVERLGGKSLTLDLRCTAAGDADAWSAEAARLRDAGVTDLTLSPPPGASPDEGLAALIAARIAITA